MSNRNKGGMSDKRKRIFVAEALEEVSSDILDLFYRIAMAALSGIE